MLKFMQTRWKKVSTDAADVNFTKKKTRREVNFGKKKFNRRKISQTNKTECCFLCGGNYPHKTDCPVKGKHCNRCNKESHVEQCCGTKFKPKCFKKQLNLVTTSSPSLEFDNDFHDDVLDVYMIGTLFTNGDNNDDIEHSNSTLESAEVNSISDF